MTMKPISVSIRQAVEITGLSRSRIYLLIQDGSLHPVKLGSRTLLSYAELEHFIRSLPNSDSNGKETK
jgi:excisionase family DNA binding protein